MSTYKRGIVDHRLGASYYGEAFDRPCLRQMPREWQLEEAKPAEGARWTRWVAVALALLLLLSCVQTVRLALQEHPVQALSGGGGLPIQPKAPTPP